MDQGEVVRTVDAGSHSVVDITYNGDKVFIRKTEDHSEFICLFPEMLGELSEALTEARREIRSRG